MQPQEEILEELNKVTVKKYKWELDVYFEDLQYKQDKIMSNIAIANESTVTLSDTYNSLMSIKTNSMISVLTIVTVIIWIMTFITGLYGMNLDLPGQNWSFMFVFIIGTMVLIGTWTLIFFKRKGWL
jgi:magnesium transporter